jgi:hypothetical protein
LDPVRYLWPQAGRHRGDRKFVPRFSLLIAATAIFRLLLEWRISHDGCFWLRDGNA